jgi:hypothetical protein
MRTRHRYITIVEATEGMVLAEAVQDRYRITLLPAGAVVSQENLQQLGAHHIEFICIDQADVRADAEVAKAAADSAKEVLDIFEMANLADPLTAALFNQVLIYRSV